MSEREWKWFLRTVWLCALIWLGVGIVVVARACLFYGNWR